MHKRFGDSPMAQNDSVFVILRGFYPRRIFDEKGCGSHTTTLSYIGVRLFYIFRLKPLRYLYNYTLDKCKSDCYPLHIHLCKYILS